MEVIRKEARYSGLIHLEEKKKKGKSSNITAVEEKNRFYLCEAL